SRSFSPEKFVRLDTDGAVCEEDTQLVFNSLACGAQGCVWTMAFHRSEPCKDPKGRTSTINYVTFQDPRFPAFPTTAGRLAGCADVHGRHFSYGSPSSTSCVFFAGIVS